MKTYLQVVRDLLRVYPDGEARALARWLFEERFGFSTADLLLDKDNHLSADDRANLQEITSRLCSGEPIQYILGHTHFGGRRFCVGPGALIPRPETAELVGHIVRALAGTPGGGDGNALSVLDIGTGSGCIALSLALEIPGAEVTAWDISPEALAIARRNGALYPEAKVRFGQADILSPPATGQCWDVIVSNPPYVRRSEARDMERNVLEHEPHTALFVPDDDPLLFYRAVAGFARSHLTAGGWLWVEINQYLSSETARLIEDFGFRDVQIRMDGFGLPRFVQGRQAD